MKRSMFVLIFVLGFSFAASAQWGWSPAERVTDTNLAMVDSMMARVYGYRGPAYYMAGGGMYGMPGGVSLKRVPCPKKSVMGQAVRAVAGAAIGAGIGYAATGSQNGAIRGAAVGGAAMTGKILYDSYRDQCYEYVQNEQQQPQVIIVQPQAQISQPYLTRTETEQTSTRRPTPIFRQGGDGAEDQLEQFELVNGTEDPARPVLVYLNGRAYKWLQPGQRVATAVPMSKAAFRAVAYQQARNEGSRSGISLVSNVAIPLDIVKTVGDSKLKFVWPKELRQND